MSTPTTGRTPCRQSSTPDLSRIARSVTLARMYYNRDGEPITLEEWSALMGSSLYRTVAQSWLGPYFISTVWLGLDHGFGRGAPLIFETMVFNEESADPDLLCERYSTEQEARQGHNETVTLIRATTDVSE